MNPKARIVEEFNPKDPLFTDRTYYVELWGGLGDIFNHVHWVHCYQNLDLLGPEDRAYVMCSSHNSFAYEILAWHPKAEQITVCNPGFYLNFQRDEWRREVGLPVPRGCSNHHPKGIRTEYYPPEDELLALDGFRKGKYIVFALTGSDHAKSISATNGLDASRIAAKHGYRVLLTGRNYYNHVAGHRRAVVREEIEISGPNVERAIGLSVPSTAKLVEGAAGVFTCHSALSMLSWHLDRPTHLLYDNVCRDKYLPEHNGGKWQGYMWGGNKPRNMNAHLSQYSPERFEEFVLSL